MRAGRRILLVAAVAVVSTGLATGAWAAGAGAEKADQTPAQGLGCCPEDLLRDMVEGADRLCYQGVRRSLGSWPRGGGRVRLYRDGAERLRVEVLGEGDEPVRTMLRVGGRSWWWSAREPSGWRERSGRRGPPGSWKHLDLLLRNYRVKLLGREELLGRPVALLGLTSEHPNRPRARLWVDLGTCLNVKMEKISPSGERTVGFEFTELSFPDRIEDKVFAVPTVTVKAPAEEGQGRRGHRPRTFADLAELARTVEAPLVVPQVVPAGFAETDISLLPRMAVVRIGYSDGLSEISLYQTPRAPGDTLTPNRPAGSEKGEATEPAAKGVESPATSKAGEGPAATGRRHGGRRGGRRGGRPGLPTEFEEMAWQGVVLQVARTRGMTFVRRTVVVGEPAVDVRTTVVGEIGDDELKAMSASLVEYRVPPPVGRPTRVSGPSAQGEGTVKGSSAGEEERR